MTKELSPQRWANDLTTILNTVYKADRFPVNVQKLAADYSHHRFPDDPVTLIQGDSLPGFDGALFRAPVGKKGWGIIYNRDITSEGRINFTLAHEFGHYLMHRERYPDGIQCSTQDLVSWESEYGQIEYQANVFSAYLLMPFDDFRKQIDPKTKPSLDDLGGCAERYKVSLVAAILRWLDYTERRSVLVMSRDGFILWARSSTPALKTGAFFRTANRPPVPVPDSALAAKLSSLGSSTGSEKYDQGIWFPEPCEEMALVSDQYDFTISLLHLDERVSPFEFGDGLEEDVVTRMENRVLGASWLG
ncbi:MAG: ImmA/IrrE family metallo-endopeptidase [Nitrospirales bacterium]|nr:ImmA/IrrE family metallo-endopeptidase [Nitrospirales bacterium]